MNNIELQKIESAKFLRVILDQNLSFKDYVNYVRTKFFKWVGIVHKLKFILPKTICVKLYKSFINSYIHYGLEV